MARRRDYTVYPTNPHAAFAAAFVCGCGKPVIGYGPARMGVFAAICPNGHRPTLKVR